MVYHNLVKAGFAVCCALMLQLSIGVFGDMLFSTNKAKAAGVQSAVAASVAPVTHK